MYGKAKRLIPTLKVLNEILATTEILKDTPVAKLTKEHCETYGPRTEVYFRVKDLDTRWLLTRKLEALGMDVSRTYCTTAGNCKEDSPMMAIRVSYRKAHGWNE